MVADVGGGTGAVLASVLAANDSARGILFDQPHVVAEADAVLRSAGVAERVTVVPGDFFTHVPEGADAYVLVRILHDWADDDAVRILRSVRAAMRPDARLLVVEAVAGPPNEDPLAKFLDLMMLVSAGGRERTEAEWSALLTAGGFAVAAASRAATNKHVIEAVPHDGPCRLADESSGRPAVSGAAVELGSEDARPLDEGRHLLRGDDLPQRRQRAVRGDHHLLGHDVRQPPQPVGDLLRTLDPQVLPVEHADGDVLVLRPRLNASTSAKS